MSKSWRMLIPELLNGMRHSVCMVCEVTCQSDWGLSEIMTFKCAVNVNVQCIILKASYWILVFALPCEVKVTSCKLVTGPISHYLECASHYPSKWYRTQLNMHVWHMRSKPGQSAVRLRVERLPGGWLTVNLDENLRAFVRSCQRSCVQLDGRAAIERLTGRLSCHLVGPGVLWYPSLQHWQAILPCTKTWIGQ